MLHGDMTLSWLMVYAQSIEESKLGRISRDAKRGRTDEQVKHKFKNMAPNQDGSSASKTNHERGCGSQMFRPTCSTCGKNTSVSV